MSANRTLQQMIKEAFENHEPQTISEDAKDIQRVKDIITKSNGNVAKMTQLASTMAKAITNKSKAFERAKASITELGIEHEVTKTFINRAIELGQDVSSIDTTTKHMNHNEQPATVIALPGSKRPHAEQYHTNAKQSHRPLPILPCGTLNLNSGENKYFNVKSNGDSCLEIWKTSDNKLKCVTTAGTTPIHMIGSRATFAHDQTGRTLFDGTMIDYIEHDNMAALIPLYGKSLQQYVYK